MKTWIQTHKGLAIALGLVALWLMSRALRPSASPGHASPDDAMAAGWSVYPAGITGWLETSPDGLTAIMHDTGWTVAPWTYQ